LCGKQDFIWWTVQRVCYRPKLWWMSNYLKAVTYKVCCSDVRRLRLTVDNHRVLRRSRSCRLSNRKVLYKSGRSLLHSCVSHTLCYFFIYVGRTNELFCEKTYWRAITKIITAIDLPQESLVESPATHSSLWVESSYLVHVDLNWSELNIVSVVACLNIRLMLSLYNNQVRFSNLTWMSSWYCWNILHIVLRGCSAE
jgi:hypothetical protein